MQDNSPRAVSVIRISSLTVPRRVVALPRLLTSVTLQEVRPSRISLLWHLMGSGLTDLRWHHLCLATKGLLDIVANAPDALRLQMALAMAILSTEHIAHSAAQNTCIRAEQSKSTDAGQSSAADGGMSVTSVRSIDSLEDDV